MVICTVFASRGFPRAPRERQAAAAAKRLFPNAGVKPSTLSIRPGRCCVPYSWFSGAMRLDATADYVSDGAGVRVRRSTHRYRSPRDPRGIPRRRGRRSRWPTSPCHEGAAWSGVCGVDGLGANGCQLAPPRWSSSDGGESRPLQEVKDGFGRGLGLDVTAHRLIGVLPASHARNLPSSTDRRASGRDGRGARHPHYARSGACNAGRPWRGCP